MSTLRAPRKLLSVGMLRREPGTGTRLTTPKGRTDALSYERLVGKGDAVSAKRTVYVWKAPLAGSLNSSLQPSAWPKARSPILKRVTLLPTSTTSPAASVPRMKGYLIQVNENEVPMSFKAQSTGLTATA